VNVESSPSKISNFGSDFRRRRDGWFRKLKRRLDEERTGFLFERERECRRRPPIASAEELSALAVPPIRGSRQ
jgi:hypothetical protein